VLVREARAAARDGAAVRGHRPGRVPGGLPRRFGAAPGGRRGAAAVVRRGRAGGGRRAGTAQTGEVPARRRAARRRRRPGGAAGDPDRVAQTIHTAPVLRGRRVLADPTGHLGRLQAAIAARFAHPGGGASPRRRRGEHRRSPARGDQPSGDVGRADGGVALPGRPADERRARRRPAPAHRPAAVPGGPGRAAGPAAARALLPGVYATAERIGGFGAEPDDVVSTPPGSGRAEMARRDVQARVAGHHADRARVRAGVPANGPVGPRYAGSHAGRARRVRLPDRVIGERPTRDRVEGDRRGRRLP
jgi:hypothetical protein